MTYDLFGNAVQAVQAEDSARDCEEVQADWFDLFDQIELPY
jgi:hypothetical protein